MDAIRGTVQTFNSFPYNHLLARVTNKIVDYMQDGPVRTKYGYLINYKKTGAFPTALRKLAISGSYERPYLNMIRCLINRNDIAVDIGAHEGYVSLFMSQIISGEGGGIYAIEPNPENLSFLKGNIKLNPDANIKVIERAMSDEKGKMSFYCSPDAGANASLIHFSYFSGDKIEVEVDTLDNLFSDLQRLNFLKVDTEGNELHVFLGGRQIILRHKPHICFEVSLTFWTHLEESVDKLFNFLQDLGYKLFVLKNDKLYPYKWLDERIINMFAVHESRVSELSKRGIFYIGEK